ncbi:unnamed protein product, partial [marine sediment metagenome]
MDIDNILKLSLKELGINFSKAQVSLVEEYLNLVYKHNKKFNLVGTKDKEGILIRHILDSISILKYKKYLFYNTNNVEKILDVGTGAGLPGVLLSIFLSIISYNCSIKLNHYSFLTSIRLHIGIYYKDVPLTKVVFYFL